MVLGIGRCDRFGAHFRHLPETIGYLRSLVKLHVCKNDLRRLPDALAHLRELKSKSHSIEWPLDSARVPWWI